MEKKRMKVLFYSPYVPKHFGGGEKHFFDVATTVAQKHDVFIALPDETANFSREKYEKFLNYSLEKLQFIPSKITSGSLFEKLQETRKFDYVYAVTDGSFFYSAAKQNNLHIQIPFTNPLNLWEKYKLRSWNIKNTNSEFTKKVVEKAWQTKITQVHYPLDNLNEITPVTTKEKVILHVGRFFKQLHSKRQDVLVSFFYLFLDQNPKLLKGWKLVLVGSIEDSEYFEEVKKQALGYPIELISNISREKLIALYQEAALYWHATGFEVDEEQFPQKVEHFGITTIEAMAAGCVPVVINKGGQKEILESIPELLWNSQTECLVITQQLIADKSEYAKMQQRSLVAVQQFSKEIFQKAVWKMF